MTTTPAPWAADTPAALAGVLTQRVAARVETLAGDEIPLDLLAGRVTFDETKAPRVLGTLSAGVPSDPAVLDRIDARLGARVVIDAGYVRGDVADVHQLVDLGLRTRSVRRPANVLDLALAGDEALLIDGAVCVTGTLTGTNTLNAIGALIHQVLPDAVIDYSALSNAGGSISQSQVDTDRMDTLTDLADRIAAQVFDDGSRTWVVRDVPTLGSTPAITVTPGKGGTLIDSDSGIDREGWANWVVIRYVWTDASNVRQRIVGNGRVTSGPYSSSSGNLKIELVERQTPATQAQADAAAAALVARMVTRGRSVVITAPSAFWLRPGDTIGVQLPTGDLVYLLVSAVEFDLVAGTMQVTTRLPDNTGAIGA